MVVGARGSVVLCCRHYAASRKIAVARPDAVNEFFSIYLILPTALGPEDYSALTEMRTRSSEIMFLGSKERPVLRADNLVSICEPIV
jgi:hypothetical protein